MDKRTTLSWPLEIDRLKLAFIRLVMIWEKPLMAAVLATVIFFGFTCFKITSWQMSPYAYFNFLADAFLHGQLSLQILPGTLHDLSLFQGKVYLYWEPLPAILIMPLVAIFGVGVSDVVVSVVVGGIIAGLVTKLLRLLDWRDWVKLSALQRALVVIFFTFGTAMTPLPQVGWVWYTHSLEALAFALLAYVTAFALEGKKAFFWTGVAVAAVLATRLSTGFIAIFPVWYLLRAHWRQGSRRLVLDCLAGALPVIITLGVLVVYNVVRFGNPLETGVSYHNMAPSFRPLYQQFGYLSWHFVPVNLYYNYFYLPYIELIRDGTTAMYGGSVFLMSPVYFAAFYALWQERKRLDTWVLLTAVLLGNLPVLMIMAPGSIAYGPRYALDFAVPLLMLTLLGMQGWRVKWVTLLVGLSVLQYLPGIVAYTRL